MARPKLEVDAEQIEELASLGANNEEIAAFCGCSVDTLTRRFAENLDKGRSMGKTRLRMLQMAAAKKGNVAMLIWLGKQLLGQSDTVTPPPAPPAPPVLNLALLTMEELNALQSLLEKAAAHRADQR